MSETDKLKSLHAAVSTDPPVPIGLLRRPQRLDSIPYEMRIIKNLVFRVFASSQTTQGEARVSCAPYCFIYQVSSPLVTQYVHYYDEDRLQIRYRMGFTETYINMPKSLISPLVSGNHDNQLLHEYVTRYTPIWRPIQFRARIDEQPSDTHVASMRAIGGHVPVEFRSYLEELLTMKRIVVAVVPSRKTKCGDHRRYASGEHLITINDTDNPLAFTLTLLHELAHAFAPRTEHSTPHDKFWKLMFANLMVDCFGFFPPELAAYVTLLACNPPSSKDICEEHMVRNCQVDGFKEQSFSQIGMLRAKMELERRFGVKLKRFD
ncbi:MAG: hypothetical protein NTY01_02315 [Verrucomicrobia bacterium]|nr:hypothetical protein [Verrucomicrobiota bacterium]